MIELPTLATLLPIQQVLTEPDSPTNGKLVRTMVPLGTLFRIAVFIQVPRLPH